MKITTIVFLLLFSAVFGSFAQDAQRIEIAPEAPFQAEILSESQLEAFHIKGIEKVQDLSDLIAAIQVEGIDTEMKKVYLSSIESMFSNPASQLLYFDDNQQLKPIALKQFLADISTQKNGFALTVNSEMGYTTYPPLSNIYTYQTPAVLSALNTEGNTISQKVKLQIIILKETKQFGDETLEIWQVLLGDMEVDSRP